MKKFLSVALVIILLICILPNTAVYAAKEESLTKLTLTVTAPKEGEKPAYDKIDGRGYYSDNGLNGTSTRIFKNGIAWYKSASSYFSTGSTATFEGNKSYIVKINILPKGDFSFDKTITATINGKAATIEYFDADGSILVEAVLTSTADNKTAINKVDLNVVRPVIGKTPTFAKVDTTQYFSEKYGSVSNCSNGVTWTNQSSNINLTVSNPFKDGTKYKVTYYLTAKEGYKFTSNTKSTINGTSADISVIDATHAKVSLGDLVPGDGKKEITSLDLSVIAPKDGEKPTYTKIDGTGYYSDNGLNGTSTKIYKNGIAWFKSASSYISPGTTETFKGGNEYTVKISLIAKDGYKFAKNITAKINGKTATVEAFDDGSINASVKITALSKEHKHTDSDWKTDKENHWKVCTDTACGTITVAKEAHKDQNKDNKCDVCGYAIPKVENKPVASQTPNTENSTIASDSEVIEDITESTTSVNNIGKTEFDDEGNPYLIWIILGIVLVVAAAAITTVIVLNNKKKKSADINNTIE